MATFQDFNSEKGLADLQNQETKDWAARIGGNLIAVYLCHFDRPISPNSTSQHYIGFANNVENRIAYHRKGQSKVRLFEVAKERGIGFQVVKIWGEGDKAFEKKIKKMKNARRYCPICNPKIK